MRLLKILYLILGIALLGVVLSEVDPATVWDRVARVGVLGMAWLLLLYFAAFVIDSYTWQMTLLEVPLSARWLYRTWKVRMVGELYNTVIPAAGFGGEPVKVALMKTHYGIGYRAGTASLILGKTVNTLALALFLMIGFAFMWDTPTLDESFRVLAALGLGGLLVGIGLFYAVQHWKVSSLAGTWLSRFRFARGLDGVLHHIHDMDDRLVGFYRGHRWRFLGALTLALVNWVLGAVEIYYAMGFLGHPVSLAEAWVIEAAAQLVRAGAFFIPAGIGAQEGTFLVICTAMTGLPALGVSVAVVRRFREVLWLLWGAVLGGLFSLRSRRSQSGSLGSE